MNPDLSSIVARLIQTPAYPVQGQLGGYPMSEDAKKEQERIEQEWRQTQEKQAFLALKIMMIQSAASASPSTGAASVIETAEELLKYALKGIREL